MSVSSWSVTVRRQGWGMPEGLWLLKTPLGRVVALVGRLTSLPRPSRTRTTTPKCRQAEAGGAPSRFGSGRHRHLTLLHCPLKNPKPSASGLGDPYRRAYPAVSPSFACIMDINMACGRAFWPGRGASPFILLPPSSSSGPCSAGSTGIPMPHRDSFPYPSQGGLP